jgi:hypothetical protein
MADRVDWQLWGTQQHEILASARLQGKLGLSGRYAVIYKLRSYIFTNKWLV